MKWVLITGGAKGIGKSVSMRLVADGYSLVCVGRDAVALEELKREASRVAAGLNSLARVETLVADLAEAGVGERVFKEIQNRGLPLPEALVSNAGDYGVLGPIQSADLKAWKKSFDLNFFSSVELVQSFVQAWEGKGQAGRKKVILMSGGGLGGSQVWPGIAGYACAKAALYRFMEVVHEEIHPLGFDVNCVAPGAVKTGITDQAERAGAEKLGKLYDATLQVKSKGGDSPELAAELIARLIGPECDGLSGRLLSAKWDRGLLGQSAEISRDKDLLRLRRIDNELFRSVQK